MPLRGGPTARASAAADEAVPSGPAALRGPLPQRVRAALQSWGPGLLSRWRAAAREIGHPLTAEGVRLRVGTDCSGLDAPVLALRAMGLKCQHQCSCDSAKPAQAFLEANVARAGGPLRPLGSAAPRMFQDMLRRDHDAMPELDVYACGFPCQPFSLLHHGSRLLREAKARPFYAMLDTLRSRLPALAVLENVVGIYRVLGKIWRLLRALGWYDVYTLTLDPKHMGEPVARPRAYFVLVRVDVAVPNADSVVARMARLGVTSERADLADRVLTSDVVPGPAPAAARGQQPPTSSETKWRAQHQGRPQARLSRPVHGLSEREDGALRIMLAEAGLRDLTPHVNVDVSQSVDRCTLTPYCPTVTPNARIVLGQQRRLLSPIEKCLVHLVPVDQLRWPDSLTHGDVARLGGNTMHLMAVGKALLFGLALVDWASPAARLRPPGDAKPPRAPAQPRQWSCRPREGWPGGPCRRAGRPGSPGRPCRRAGRPERRDVLAAARDDLGGRAVLVAALDDRRDVLPSHSFRSVVADVVGRACGA